MTTRNGERGNGDAARIEPAVHAISQESRRAAPVAQHLQRQLANGFVLYANFKRYQWQANGPLARDLHALFDALGAEVLAMLDPLAERLRRIGQDPVAAPDEVLAKAGVVPAPVSLTPREMIEQAQAHAALVIREMRDAVRVAADDDDPRTADLLARLVQVHEKHEWWLRDLLERGDRLLR
jgi:starvation-inducible DNA-binding protein